MKSSVGRLAAFLALCASAQAFTLDDIHFWVGEGPHCAGIVLDWSQNDQPALVWGYRWSGDTPPTLDIALRAIAAEDNRLSLLAPDGDYGMSLYALGYDLADSGAVFQFDYNGGDVVALSSDTDSLVAGGWYSGYWCQWVCASGTTYTAPTADDYGWGATYTDLEDQSWHVFQFSRPEWGWDFHAPAEPAAATSPYACDVVAATYETDPGFNQWTNASAVLGAPSRRAAATDYGPGGPVSPANTAFGTDQVLSLVHGYDWDTDVETPGSVTVRFDHPVVDDPLNPYGLDFIVFGNALLVAGGYFDPTNDPTRTAFKTASCIAEPGLVEVSQDGLHWFAFSSGPYADTWAPTLGFQYDPAHADASLFAENQWWGAPTDATRPLDPALTAASFKGQTLAQVAQLYEGSAGGTGFDIGGFNLPRDARGRKWIQYVRVTSLTTSDDAEWTEVDAFADVAPATSYDLWTRAHYTAAERVAGNASESVPCANGRSNLENAALGLAPDAVSDAALRIADFRLGEGVATFAVDGAPNAFDLVRVASSATLTTSKRAWTSRLPVYRGIDTQGRALYEVPLDSTAAAAFFKLHLE